jgi:hypothetical protein
VYGVYCGCVGVTDTHKQLKVRRSTWIAVMDRRFLIDRGERKGLETVDEVITRLLKETDKL